MNTKTFSWVAAATVAFSSLSFAGPTKSYQVTGPVLEINEKMIAVQKGQERWEIARDAEAKAEGVKVGDRVTIMYTMTAKAIEVKADKAARAEGRTSPTPAASPAKP